MYQSLNLFLVSTESNLNVTVSEGPQYLTQEPGSTVSTSLLKYECSSYNFNSKVKHLTYSIPTCVTAGAYNVSLTRRIIIFLRYRQLSQKLTVYEMSRINSTVRFLTQRSLVLIHSY